MDDLTVLYITANEMPKNWIAFQQHHLAEAIGDAPVIVITRELINCKATIILDTEPKKSYWNIYRQMLVGALVANTPYIAVAEDDVLYSKEHFNQFRPSSTQVSYNRSRWSLFAWDPVYCLRQRVSNCSLIAPRDLLIDAIQERENKYPDGNDYAGEIGRPIVEKTLGVSRRDAVEWYSTVPIIQLNHPNGIDLSQQRKWKKHGQIKANDIPFWGKAKDIAGIYNGSKAWIPQRGPKTI